MFYTTTDFKQDCKNPHTRENILQNRFMIIYARHCKIGYVKNNVLAEYDTTF